MIGSLQKKAQIFEKLVWGRKSLLKYLHQKGSQQRAPLAVL